jgi:phosphoglycerate dehydrogenase-like enzyme
VPGGLAALVPDDVMPDDPPVPMASIGADGVGDDVDLDQVGFFVPPYMGPPRNLELMARMPNLEVVQLLTAGFESAQPFVPPGVLLCNAGGVHDASTSELALGLILASLRGIDDFARAMPTGRWSPGRRRSLADARVVVIGAGGVGQAIARRLEPFETDVTLVGRSARDGVADPGDLPDLIGTADIVVLAVPLTDATTGLVDDGFLSCMRDGALLVNVARGPVIDTEALLVHASSGRIRAALDVTDPEPLPAEHPLWRVPGVLISPHVGGNSTAFLPRARSLVAEQLGRWSSGERLLSIVSG